jgi:ribonuclease-3 family protein
LLMTEPFDLQALREYSPVVLAYIGDAVFELMVRTYLVARGNRPIKELHHDAVAVVKAESQARVVRQMMGKLSDEEKEIIRRGRNAKTTPPRHADPGDYHMSTGFEALLGYLYLKGDEERLHKLVMMALDSGNGTETAL